jgi:hypothetical protein
MNDMNAASTSYEGHAGLVPAVTAVRRRRCGTMDTAAQEAIPSFSDMSAVTMA